jgi:hypothetical protein
MGYYIDVLHKGIGNWGMDWIHMDQDQDRGQWQTVFYECYKSTFGFHNMPEISLPA